jgi:hypothetical protein
LRAEFDNALLDDVFVVDDEQELAALARRSA